MGDPATQQLLIPALGQILTGAAEGLTAPSPFQPRKPYTGSLDPEATLADEQSLLKFIAPGLLDRAQSDVTLPDAVVHNVDPVGGFSLGDVGSLAKPASLPGLKFGGAGTSFGFPSSGGSTTPPSQASTGPSPGYTDPGGVDHPGDAPQGSDAGTYPYPTSGGGGGGGGGDAEVPGRDTRIFQASPRALRQRFAPEVPSAQPDNGVPQDPTQAALALLRHAASSG